MHERKIPAHKSELIDGQMHRSRQINALCTQAHSCEVVILQYGKVLNHICPWQSIWASA